MKKSICTIILFLGGNILALNGYSAELKIAPPFGKSVESCRPSKKTAPFVYFFKQWHLGPNVDTKNSAAKSYPQEKNLESIYLQLEAWAKEGTLTQIIAEGCSGTIDSKSTYRVNGWTVQDLEKIIASDNFSKVLTSVPLKIESKYGAQIKTVCGDREDLVKEQLLGFSDARGDLGYLSRLIEYKNDPEKIKPYLKDVIDLFKLPKTTSVDGAVRALKKDLNKTVKRIFSGIEKRNQQLVETILSSSEKSVAVVYGGLHAEGVKKNLEKRGINCLLIEPSGYQNNEVDFLKQLETAMKKL